MKKRENKRQLNKMFYDRMIQLGYADVTSFALSSEVDISFETCRRLINDDRQDVRYEYVLALMQSLDFTPQEIAAELKRRGDKHIHRLVAESAKGVILTDRQKTIFDKVRKDRTLEDLFIQIIERDGKK